MNAQVRARPKFSTETMADIGKNTVWEPEPEYGLLWSVIGGIGISAPMILAYIFSQFKK